MARRWRRIPIGHVAPLRAGTENPQDAVQHLPVVLPRTTSPIGTALWLWDQWLENAPLFIRELHRSSLSAFHDAVEEQLIATQLFVRQLLVSGVESH